MLSCSKWFSAPSFWMGGGLQNCCVSRVYGAGGAVHGTIRTVNTTYAADLKTTLLTYSMVQSPSWEANWSAASQEIPRISRNPKVHYRTHKHSQDHHPSKNSVQKTICCNSTSNAPDNGRTYQKHVELRTQIKLPSCIKWAFHFISRGRYTVKHTQIT